MTFRLYFYAEQAFLSEVDRFISDTGEITFEEEVSKSAVCILALAAALESTANNLLIKIHKTTDERLDIEQKIRATLEGSPLKNWGNPPLQNIKKLIQARNWLAHFKNNEIGLFNSSNQWVKDCQNDIPKFSPDEILTKEHIRKLLDSVLKTIEHMAINCDGNTSEYEFLHNRKYQIIIAG